MGQEGSTSKMLGNHLKEMRDNEAYCQDEAAQAANLKQIHEKLDLDNNGYIDAGEINAMWDSFKKAFKSAAEKEPALMKDLKKLDDFDFKQLKAKDFNQDGKYDLVEFTAMVNYMFNRLSQ
mmetsp:Transcript_7222/g.12155  ORF Transcript_7222/g.12155 Transcript_7222/m.12155 type:complete len:121 (-) Transcript_7222:71-433(-)